MASNSNQRRSGSTGSTRTGNARSDSRRYDDERYYEQARRTSGRRYEDEYEDDFYDEEERYYERRKNSSASGRTRTEGSTSRAAQSARGRTYEEDGYSRERSQRTASGSRASSASRNGSGRSSASRSSAAKRKKAAAKKRKRIILFSVEIVALLVLAVICYKIFTTASGTQKININEEEVVQNFNDTVKENTTMQGYRNIALFGVDSRNKQLDKGARTDTIMIASINQDTKDVKLVSVYRDTYLNLGNDTYNKCNSAYARGGPEQAILMLNSNLDMNITDFVTVSFDAMIEVIDALGGVQIDVQEDEIKYLNDYQASMFMTEEGGQLNTNYTPVTSAGMQTLNGLQATAYCRIRYTKGDDFRRAERQRTVLMAMLDKAKQASPTALLDALDRVVSGGYVATSLGIEEMTEVLQDVASYNIVANDGFPFEGSRDTGTIGSKGSCVIPVDLEKNVIALHQFLFEQEEYAPSSQVQEYSQKIASDTGRSAN